MRVLSGEANSEIVMNIAPMRPEKIVKDEFFTALLGVFPYVQLMMFLLPIYMQILRL